MNSVLNNMLKVRIWADGLFRYRCLWMAVSFAAGILISEQHQPDVRAVLFGSAASAALCAFFRKKNSLFFILMVVSFFLLGILHCRAVSFLPADHIERIFRKEGRGITAVSGIVTGDVKKNSGKTLSQVFELQAKEVFYMNGYSRRTQGRILARVFAPAEVHPGDFIKLSGTLHAPHDFKMGHKGSYQEYLRQNGIYLILTVGKKGSVEQREDGRGRWIFIRARETIKSVLDRYLPVFESGILKAVLIGDRTGVSYETRQVFLATGTAHVLAISGLHMGVIMGIFLVCAGFLPVPFRVKYCLAAVLMAAYMPLAGARASVLRSGIMAGLFLFSVISERRFCSLNILGLAGLLILLFRPLDLYAAGFQLSFSATAALILFSDPFFRFFKKLFKDLPDWITQTFCVSLAAWLGTSGLVLYHFGTVTPAGLVANLCAVFLMAVMIGLGLMLVVFGVMQVPFLPQVIAADLRVVVNVLMSAISWISRLPMGHFTNVEINDALCLGYYGILAAAGLGLAFLKARKPSDMRGLS